MRVRVRVMDRVRVRVRVKGHVTCMPKMLSPMMMNPKKRKASMRMKTSRSVCAWVWECVGVRFGVRSVG